MVAFWLSLLLLLVALVAGVAYVVLRGLQMWRLVKRTGDAFGDETARISRATAQIEGHLAEASAAAVRLKARADVRRALWFVPGL